MIVTDVTDEVVDGAAVETHMAKGAEQQAAAAEAECAAGRKHAVWQCEHHGPEFAGAAGAAEPEWQGQAAGAEQAEE